MAKNTSEETPSEMIGKKAPAFALLDQDGKTHKLPDYRGKHVVLYWYPRTIRHLFPSGTKAGSRPADHKEVISCLP